MLVCLKKQIMAVKNWDEILEVVYREGKLIKLKAFKPLYITIF